MAVTCQIKTQIVRSNAIPTFILTQKAPTVRAYQLYQPKHILTYPFQRYTVLVFPCCTIPPLLWQKIYSISKPLLQLHVPIQSSVQLLNDCSI